MPPGLPSEDSKGCEGMSSARGSRSWGWLEIEGRVISRRVSVACWHSEENKLSWSLNWWWAQGNPVAQGRKGVVTANHGEQETKSKHSIASHVLIYNLTVMLTSLASCISCKSLGKGAFTCHSKMCDSPLRLSKLLCTSAFRSCREIPQAPGWVHEWCTSCCQEDCQRALKL